MLYCVAGFDSRLFLKGRSAAPSPHAMIMFYGASNFNQSLDDWNVACVTDMGFMFNKAAEFNQSLNDWNVASVTTMNEMF